jgi:hypothetical protein
VAWDWVLQAARNEPQSERAKNNAIKTEHFFLILGFSFEPAPKPAILQPTHAVFPKLRQNRGFQGCNPKNRHSGIAFLIIPSLL